MKARLVPIALLLLPLIACRHPIEIIGEGDVVSASGNRDCLLEDFQGGHTNCTKNRVRGKYNETYFAVPRAGSQFVAWGNYCAEPARADQCKFKLAKQHVKNSPVDEAPPLVAYFRKELKTAHKALLMGHSFFNPFANALPADLANAGVDGHTQFSFTAGGSGGAPLSFWNSEEHSASIKNTLDAGGFSLLGMTYYPLEEQGISLEENLQGYRNWIDYALNQNDGFSVFIGMPWARNSADFAYKEWYSDWSVFHEGIHDFVDALRRDYPQLDIYCLPYGLAVMELNKRFEEGNVPDLLGEVGESGADYMFTDNLGHAGGMVYDLVRLTWLRAIYGIDLETYQDNYNYSVDLSEIATLALNRHDHRYDPQ